MSPRLTSSRLMAPVSRMSSSTRSSTAMPREPKASKKADCGLNTAITPPSSSTIPRAQASSPFTSVGNPQAASTDGIGSMPTQRFPRCLTVSESLLA